MALLPSLLIKALTATQLFSKPITIVPIKGGSVNQSYKLVSGDLQYFLKTFAQDHLIANNRRETYLLQAKVALLGFAPLPIYISDTQEFQVEQWVDRECLSDADLARTEQIHQLAGALCEIHKLQVPAKSLDLPSIWQGYLNRAELSADWRLFDNIESCQQLWLSSCEQDQALCHNDLGMGHVMLGQPSLLLDWEYAAMGNRFFDLASCAAINGFSPADTVLLQQSYSEQAALPLQQVQQKMKVQHQLVELTNQLWYLAAGIDKT